MRIARCQKVLGIRQIRMRAQGPPASKAYQTAKQTDKQADRQAICKIETMQSTSLVDPDPDPSIYRLMDRNLQAPASRDALGLRLKPNTYSYSYSYKLASSISHLTQDE